MWPRLLQVINFRRIIVAQWNDFWPSHRLINQIQICIIFRVRFWFEVIRFIVHINFMTGAQNVQEGFIVFTFWQEWRLINRLFGQLIWICIARTSRIVFQNVLRHRIRGAWAWWRWHKIAPRRFIVIDFDRCRRWVNGCWRDRIFAGWRRWTIHDIQIGTFLFDRFGQIEIFGRWHWCVVSQIFSDRSRLFTAWRQIVDIGFRWNIELSMSTRFRLLWIRCRAAGQCRFRFWNFNSFHKSLIHWRWKICGRFGFRFHLFVGIERELFAIFLCLFVRFLVAFVRRWRWFGGRNYLRIGLNTRWLSLIVGFTWCIMAIVRSGLWFAISIHIEFSFGLRFTVRIDIWSIQFRFWFVVCGLSSRLRLVARGLFFRIWFAARRCSFRLWLTVRCLSFRCWFATRSVSFRFRFAFRCLSFWFWFAFRCLSFRLWFAVRSISFRL